MKKRGGLSNGRKIQTIELKRGKTECSWILRDRVHKKGSFSPFNNVRHQ